MKIIMINTIISICILVSQNEYPYLQDPVKQYEFEQLRIYISEDNSQRMIVSGGEDTYQLFDSIIEGKSVYRQQPIRTSYYYNSRFEIKVNGKIINEIEFLQIVGLDSLASEILENYYKKLADYEDKLADVISLTKTPEVIRVPLAKKIDWLGYFGVSAMVVPYILGDPENSDDENAKEVFVTAGAIMTSLYLLSWLIPIEQELVYETPAVYIDKPVLEQQLDNQQIISISESYNRRIFNEIKSK